MTAPRPYPPDWCDLETIAYLTSMSRATFAQWVKAGSLPDGVRMGGKRLWNRYAVFAAIDEMAGAGKARDCTTMFRSIVQQNAKELKNLEKFWGVV